MDKEHYLPFYTLNDTELNNFVNNFPLTIIDNLTYKISYPNHSDNSVDLISGPVKPEPTSEYVFCNNNFNFFFVLSIIKKY